MKQGVSYLPRVVGTNTARKKEDTRYLYEYCEEARITMTISNLCFMILDLLGMMRKSHMLWLTMGHGFVIAQ